jgi:hypothetical protein
MWHQRVYDLLDVPVGVDPVAHRQVAAFERRAQLVVPPAVREWLVGDWRDWTTGQHVDYPPTAETVGLLSPRGPGRRFLLVDRDSQDCCAFITPVDEGDDPPVYRIAPDDAEGTTRSVFARSFRAYALTMVWDLQLFIADGGESVGRRTLPPTALAWLNTRLTRIPSTYGWSGNSTCDTVHRFTGPAKVWIQITADEISYGLVKTSDRALETEILAALAASPVDQY